MNNEAKTISDTAQIARGLDYISNALRDLGIGDAYSPTGVGAVEYLADETRKGLKSVADGLEANGASVYEALIACADALSSVADAIRESKEND